jgi:hypothetical protein
MITQSHAKELLIESESRGPAAAKVDASRALHERFQRKPCMAHIDRLIAVMNKSSSAAELIDAYQHAGYKSPAGRGSQRFPSAEAATASVAVKMRDTPLS